MKHEWWSVMSVYQSGALVNVVNNHGNASLHEAVRGGHVQLVELLLHRGALLHIRNKRQRTALDCAHDTGGKVCTCLCALSWLISYFYMYTHCYCTCCILCIDFSKASIVTLNIVCLFLKSKAHFLFFSKNTEIQRLLQKACADTVESNLIKSHTRGPERIVGKNQTLILAQQ